MRREAKGKRVKQTLDVLIILCGAGAVFLLSLIHISEPTRPY